MLSKKISTFAVSLAFLFCSLPTLAQLAPPQPLPKNVPALLVKANEAYIAKDHQAFRSVLEKLHRLRPNNSDYMYQLVIAHALLDDKAKAYELMLKMQQQGLAYDFTESEATVGIRNTQVFEYVNDLMVKAGEPMGESELMMTLADVGAKGVDLALGPRPAVDVGAGGGEDVADPGLHFALPVGNSAFSFSADLVAGSPGFSFGAAADNGESKG